MSTRSNVLFKLDNEYYQLYVHWDGYPSSRLKELIEFLKWNGSRNEDISYTVANYIFYVKAEIMEWNVSENDKNGDSNSNSHLGIGLIPVKLPNDPYFDALFIEWFYIVDLSTRTIEVLEPRYEAKGSFEDNTREYITKEPKRLGVFDFDSILSYEQLQKLDEGKRILKKEIKV